MHGGEVCYIVTTAVNTGVVHLLNVQLNSREYGLSNTFSIFKKFNNIQLLLGKIYAATTKIWKRRTKQRINIQQNTVAI